MLGGSYIYSKVVHKSWFFFSSSSIIAFIELAALTNMQNSIRSFNHAALATYDIEVGYSFDNTNR